MLDCFSKYETKLQLEKLVIGLEEPILIKGVGRFLAKVDSGNGGYNVLHGENVIQQGDVITFKTYDENEQPKMVSKKLKEFINVNIGSGNVEERPVIELDVKFAGELYKKIPFSVANRNSNTHKILICKDFVQKELDALIDVSGKSITKDKIEVEYVKENTFTNNIKDVKDEMKRDDTTVGQKAGYVARKVGKGLLQSLQQAGKFTDAQTIGDAEKSEKADIISGYADQAAEDSVLIKKQVAKMKPETFGFDKNYKIQEKDIICFKLVDYLGKYFGGDEVVPSEKQMFDEYQQILNNNNQSSSITNVQNDKFSDSQQKDKQAALNLVQDAMNKLQGNKSQNQTQNQNNNQQKPQQQQQQKPKNESFLDTLGRLLTEATTQQGNSNSGNTQPNEQPQQQQANTDNQQQQKEDKKNADGKQDEVKNEGQEVSGNIDEYQKKYQLRNVFFTYFVLVDKNASGEKKATWNTAVSKVFNDNDNLKKLADTTMINLGNKNVDQKNGAILNLFNDIKEKLSSIEGIKGTFAFCYTKGGLPKKGTRKCVIMKDNIVGVQEAATNEQKANPEDIKNDYATLRKDWENNMFLKNVKMDINSKYDNEEKRNELKELAANKPEENKPTEEQQEQAPAETPQENEETITESFLPYLNMYVNRVYGYKYYVTEDANEEQQPQQQEQKPAEEGEKKEEEKQTGPTGEDALANVDFKAIADKQEDKSTIAKEAEKAEQLLTNFVNTVQKGYFTLDSETQKTLGLEVFEPKVEDVKETEQSTEERKDIDIDDKEAIEELNREASPETKKEIEEISKEGQDDKRMIDVLTRQLAKANEELEKAKNEKEQREFYNELRKEIMQQWSELKQSWEESCKEVGINVPLSIGDLSSINDDVYNEVTKAEEILDKDDSLSEEEYENKLAKLLNVYTLKLKPIEDKLRGDVLKNAYEISKELDIDLNDLFPPSGKTNQKQPTKKEAPTEEQEEQAWSLNRYFARD